MLVLCIAKYNWFNLADSLNLRVLAPTARETLSANTQKDPGDIVQIQFFMKFRFT